MSRPDGVIAYPAAAGGIATRVLEAGTGAETVLFVHGVGARADRWRRNLGPVAQAGFRCLAIDLPGHGFAYKGPKFRYGVPGYADFVEAFLDEHAVGAAHFVGTSLGAHILGTVACRRPARAKSFALVGATGMFPIGVDARTAIAGRIGDRTRDGIKRKLLSVIFDPAKVDDALAAEEFEINNSPGAEASFAALAEYFRTGLDDDVVGPQLAALGPALRKQIIWGEQDRSVPLAVGRKVEALLEAPLHVIPGTAHAPYWEAPDDFNDALLRFLKG